METMISNLINGNIKDARNQATKYPGYAITKYLRENLGWSADRSRKAAHFLKTGYEYQAYCDAA